jgi:uncharacterized protein (DUF342 family)
MADPLFIQDPNAIKRFEIKRHGYALVFQVSAHDVECRCTYEPSTTGGAPLTGEELQGFLTQYKICEGVSAEALSNLLNAAASGKAVSELLIACGTTVTPGTDGQLLLSVSDALASAADGEGQENGSMDLRKVQSFFNVEAEQQVATLLPPGPGKAGRTVFGKEIPPQPGTPFPLKTGLNVRRGDDGRSIFAESAGRVCVREYEISVEDVYEVDGDAGFNVGNILFRGFVEIKGDILDGFSVKATKGIKVHGIIGACTIESDGDIAFSGMNGQSTGTITCGGSVTANYINDTSIECTGDVTVEVEIRNSHIRSLGAIRVNKQGIAGGEYFALAGIESAILGNLASQHTRVVAGVHYRDLEELNLLFNELKQLIAQFNAAPKETIDLKEFARLRAAITGRTQAVRLRTYEQCNPKINVRKRLHEGVNITLGNLSDLINEERKGPLSIIENTIEGGFRYLGMTSLSFKAQAIEQTFIRQQELEQKRLNAERTWEGV